MDTYASPKEALKAAGRIKEIGRGRISRENHAWLDAEQAAGRIRISNAVIPKATAPVADKAAPKQTKYGSNTEKVVNDFTILYHWDAYHAKGGDGKTYSMREVCNTCRVSLVQNVCEHPTILGNIPVKIIPNASA